MVRVRLKAARAAAGAALVAALLAGCAEDTGDGGGPGAPAAAATAGPSAANALQANYVSVVQGVLPSVVQITTGTGLGSGIVFDDRGDIVTNAHVVGAAKTFQVRLAGSASAVPARLVGLYQPDDLAVIRLDELPSPAPKPARFGDSGALEVGDIVLAMGNPLGLASSVTDGIVSATGRTVAEPAEQGVGGAVLPQVIQTSAAINPGNSGGALVNLAGEVIGVPTLAAADPQFGGAAAGIGFAIPSNLVKDIAGQLISGNGHVANTHRAALGVQAVTVADQAGTPLGVGIVSVTAGGPAAAAGLKDGEVITAVAGRPVRSAADLLAALAELDPGAVVPVEVTTAGARTRTVQVTLDELPGT